jgi:UDP-N-acetylglucosamine 2-epimerase (non-hydrolysing)
MEEASILNFPAISLRDTTERSEGMEEGVLIISGFKRDKLINGVKIITNNNSKKISKLVNDYNVNNISDKISNIIVSYTDYINNKVWKKNVKTF